MDEKELELEEIIKEFGGTALAQPEENTPVVLQEEPEEALPEPSQQEEEELEEFDEDAFLSLVNSKPAQTEELEQTRRIEPVSDAEPQPAETPELEKTRRMELVTEEKQAGEVSGDTIRLDDVVTGIAQRAKEEKPVEDTEVERIWKPSDTLHAEPFSKHWEPEYEQPIGEYIPPQPIAFQPRSRLRELKKKLVEGPEKRFYELSEKGLGKLQAAIFLSLLVVLICAVSTAMYAFGAVQENRMRLMVFGQFLAMLISALLGSYQLIEGAGDIFRKRFTLNSLLVMTFLACCADGILCLSQVRVPCCAAFSLEMTMSLWSTYHRRNTEMSRMDTMRKATRLDGVAACSDYLDGKKGLLRVEGQVEDFMDCYAQQSKPEKALNIYSFVAMCVALAVGIFAGVMQGVSAGVQVTAVSLLAAVPATAFITHSRPTWILERRLHRLGTVLCGWQGVEGLAGKTVFPLTYGDLYPNDAVRLNGVKYFGSRQPDLVVAYAAAVITAEGCGLANLFANVLDAHNGRHYDACDLTHYENGGICGVVEGETVLVGSAAFLKDMDVEVPDNAKLSYAVYVAIEGELSGLFAVSYEKTQSAAAGLATLNAYRGLQCALVSDDFMLTHGFLKGKFGVKPKRFLLPDHQLRELLRQKQPDETAKTLLMTTSLGLAPLAFGVTGARALRTTCRMGTVLHIVGGGIGLGIMALLSALGALELLTPANMFLYQLVWMIPALLFTEWTRSI